MADHASQNEEHPQNNSADPPGLWATIKSAVNSRVLSTFDVAREYIPQDSDGIEQAITKTLGFLMHYVVCGVAVAGIPPVGEKAQELLDEHDGNILEAVREVVRGGDEESTMDMAIDTLLTLIPYSGAMALIIKSQWKPLRNIAIIAALFGHDTTSLQTQSTMLWCLVPDDSNGNNNDEVEAAMKQNGEDSSGVAMGAGAGAGGAGGMGGSTMSEVAKMAVAKAIISQVIRKIGTRKFKLLGAQAFFAAAATVYSNNQQQKQGTAAAAEGKGTKRKKGDTEELDGPARQGGRQRQAHLHLEMQERHN